MREDYFDHSRDEAYRLCHELIRSWERFEDRYCAAAKRCRSLRISDCLSDSEARRLQKISGCIGCEQGSYLAAYSRACLLSFSRFLWFAVRECM